MTMPAATLPTRDELKKLPLRAVVAYATRCARRVQTLFRQAEGIPDLARHKATVEQLITVADRFCRGEDCDATAAYVATASDASAPSRVGSSTVGTVGNSSVGTTIAATRATAAELQAEGYGAAYEAAYLAARAAHAAHLPILRAKQAHWLTASRLAWNLLTATLTSHCRWLFWYLAPSRVCFQPILCPLRSLPRHG